MPYWEAVCGRVGYVPSSSRIFPMAFIFSSLIIHKATIVSVECNELIINPSTHFSRVTVVGSVCLSVCVSVTLHLTSQSCHKRILCTSRPRKIRNFERFPLKTLCSKVMAWFAYRGNGRCHIVVTRRSVIQLQRLLKLL